MRACIENLQDRSFAADIPLIYSTKMDPDVLATLPGPSTPCGPWGGVGTYVLANRNWSWTPGATVAVGLCRFLITCGVASILLVGQDFAWSGKSTTWPGTMPRPADTSTTPSATWP
jgi:hypothetical protein